MRMFDAPVAARILSMRKQLIFRHRAIDRVESRALTAAVNEGRLVRVIRGCYVDQSTWEGWFHEQRVLARTIAVAELQAARRPVFSHQSAAVIWGLPLVSERDGRAHVVTPPAAPGRSSPIVQRHVLETPHADIVSIAGMNFTSLDRTMIDLMRFATMNTAISAADAGLRLQFGACKSGLPAEVESWRAEHLGRLGRHAGYRGNTRARQILELADPRADSVAESVSRLQLTRLRVPVEIQVRVVGPSGAVYWVDFEFLGQRTFGEVDGVSKYSDPSLRGERSALQAVMREKRREDEIRGVSQFALARWEPSHANTARALGNRLQAFGVRVPALETGQRMRLLAS